LILHRRPKLQAIPDRPRISDIPDILSWRDYDRAVITFMEMEDVISKKDVLTGVIQKWIKITC